MHGNVGDFHVTALDTQAQSEENRKNENLRASVFKLIK